jgi:carbamoyl-phosphate synthase small subunit
MIVDSIDNLAEIITKIKSYNTPNAMDYVCVKEPVIKGTGSLKIALYDFGVKGNIVDSLVTRNCKVCIYPANYSYEQMQDFLPDGYVISNGPCNPEDNIFSIQQIKKMYDSNTPILGICLGHQMMGLAVGFKTAKLKYGHRGPNHPCKFVPNGINYITSQNHGYYITEESINPAIAKPSFINTTDNTNEGLSYINKNIETVQFHPEACPGPQDTEFLFDNFVNTVKEVKYAKK